MRFTCILITYGILYYFIDIILTKTGSLELLVEQLAGEGNYMCRSFRVLSIWIFMHVIVNKNTWGQVCAQRGVISREVLLYSNGVMDQ